MELERSRPVLLDRSLCGLLALLVVLAAGLYYWQVPGDPRGFSIDESSISYNAYTISQSGCDEYNNAWPLFFRAFGEYKNPIVIYILAALFRITGPSIFAARALSATFGLLTGLLLGLLNLENKPTMGSDGDSCRCSLAYTLAV